MPEVVSYYFNGLGDGTLHRGELAILDRQRQTGMTVHTANINYRKGSFPTTRDQLADQTSQLLAPLSPEDYLYLEGSSAGVSMALAVRALIDDPRLRVLGHSGRVRRGELAWWDPRTLEHCAHLGTKQESRSFYDAVIFCEEEVIPNMTDAHKAATLLTTPLLGVDEIVPGLTMPIEGVRNVVVPVATHTLAIGYGMSQAPRLIQAWA